MTRASFLLSKLIGYAVGFGALALTLPLVAFIVERALIAGEGPRWWPLAQAMGLWGLHLLVYLSVTLALGTIVGHRGPVAAIGLGALLAGQFLGGLVPGPVLTFLPWALPHLADAVAHGRPGSGPAPVSVAANLTIVVAALAAGVWRLNRQDL